MKTRFCTVHCVRVCLRTAQMHVGSKGCMLSLKWGLKLNIFYTLTTGHELQNHPKRLLSAFWTYMQTDVHVGIHCTQLNLAKRTKNANRNKSNTDAHIQRSVQTICYQKNRAKDIHPNTLSRLGCLSPFHQSLLSSSSTIITTCTPTSGSLQWLLGTYSSINKDIGQGKSTLTNSSVNTHLHVG